MRAATTRWIAVCCGALLAGAGLAFVPRDVLGLEQPAVAIARVVGVAAGLAAELTMPSDVPA